MIDTRRHYRKVIRITAEDSPNVKLGLAQEAAGQVPTNEILVPGVINYDAYKTFLSTWGEVRKCIGLWGQFWKGAEALLYPPAWLNIAELLTPSNDEKRYPNSLGIDSGEGGDDSSWAVVNRTGLVHMTSLSTPDTTVIPRTTIALMQQFKVEPRNVVFDAGGGGKQHADALRAKGLKVRTVRFGESPSLDPRRGLQMIETRLDMKEDKYTYVNRRAEMAHELSQLLDPDSPDNPCKFALPKCNPLHDKLRHQLSMVPKQTDSEGRYILPPKRPKPGSKAKDEVTLISIIGYSPNEWDALMCAVHAMLHKPIRSKAGAG